MKISSVKAFPLAIPFRGLPGGGYDSSFGMIKTLDTILVIVKTDKGIVGVGESQVVNRPAPIELGTASGGFLDIINNWIGPALIGEDPSNLNKLNEKMDRVCYGSFVVDSIKAGVDYALYDIVGKATGKRAVDLIGGAVREKIAPLEGWVGMADPKIMAKEAKNQIDRYGVQVLKVKIGGGRIGGKYPSTVDPEMDVQRLKAIREAVGDKVLIVADVNMGYTPDVAIRTIRKFDDLNVFVESPVAIDDIDGLVRVAKSVSSPIISDECSYSPRQLIKLIQKDIIEYFNLKPIRAGGFTGAMKSVRIIETAGLKCSVDSALETMVGSTALTHVAAAVRDDAFLWTIGGGCSTIGVQDRIVKKGGVRTERGYCMLPDVPGLGLELKDEVMKLAEGYRFPQIIPPPSEEF